MLSLEELSFLYLGLSSKYILFCLKQCFGKEYKEKIEFHMFSDVFYFLDSPIKQKSFMVTVITVAQLHPMESNKQ